MVSKLKPAYLKEIGKGGIIIRFQQKGSLL